MEMPDMVQPANDPETPENEPGNFDSLTRFLFVLGGTIQEIMQRCPKPDHVIGRATGLLAICDWVYITTLFSLIGTSLFGKGQFNIGIIAGCAFLASYILVIDTFMFGYSWNNQAGLNELKRGGLDLTGGLADRVKSHCYLAVRIALSVGLAQLTAIAFGLLLFAADISARINSVYHNANAAITQTATGLVNATMQRATTAVTHENVQAVSLAAQVNSLRQAEIDPTMSGPGVQAAQRELDGLIERRSKAEDDIRSSENYATSELGGLKLAPGSSGLAGAGPRYRAAMERVADAKARAHEIDNEIASARDRLNALRDSVATAGAAKKQDSQGQLPAFEKALADEQTRLQTLKDQLADLTAHRNEKIEEAVESSPDYVPRNDGMLAQIVALEHIAQDDNKVALVILLIDLVSFGFELGLVTCKVTANVPTTYSAILARDVYMRAVRIVDGMLEELNRRPANDNGPDGQAAREAANDNPVNGHTATGTDGLGFADGAQPPKRKRGRPKGSGRVKGPNGSRGNSGTLPEPQK